jgi:flagellar FliL protein
MADPKKTEEVNASLEDDSGAGGEEGGGGGGGKKKLIIIIVILLLVLGGAGAGLYFSGFLDKYLKKSEATEAGNEGEHAEAAEEEAPPCKEEEGKECPKTGTQFLKIPDMIVNLNSEDGTPRYLRLSVQLEFKNAADLEAVEKVLPRVTDQFQTYLRELRVRDLRGSAGIYRLQMELLARVNQAAYPTEVQDVLFQEILIQ